MKTASILTVVTVTVGLALAPGCGTSDRPATWAYISPVIFQPNCATSSCHSRGAAVAGLDFSDPDRGYTSLTGLWVWIVDRTKEGQPGCGRADGTIVCEEQFRPLITPYDPSASRLINLLRGRDAPRMPPDRPLDEADIELVEDWILNGAKKSEKDVAPPSGGGPIDGGAGGDAHDAGADADGGADVNDDLLDATADGGADLPPDASDAGASGG